MPARIYKEIYILDASEGLLPGLFTCKTSTYQVTNKLLDMTNTRDVYIPANTHINISRDTKCSTNRGVSLDDNHRFCNNFISNMILSVYLYAIAALDYFVSTCFGSPGAGVNTTTRQRPVGTRAHVKKDPYIHLIPVIRWLSPSPQIASYY
jgi:hypothetical protein